MFSLLGVFTYFAIDIYIYIYIYIVWFLFNSKETQNNHEMTGFLLLLIHAPIATFKLAAFSYDALSNPTGAMKVSSAKPVMLCNMHLVINNSI